MAPAVLYAYFSIIMGLCPSFSDIIYVVDITVDQVLLKVKHLQGNSPYFGNRWRK